MRAVYYGQQEELLAGFTFLLRVFFRGRGKRWEVIHAVNIMHGAEGGRWILCTDFSTGVYNGRVVEGVRHLNPPVYFGWWDEPRPSDGNPPVFQGSLCHLVITPHVI